MTAKHSDVPSDAVTQRVHSAVDAHIAPRELETYVGQKAAVNTTAGFPIDGLRRVNLIPDPEHPEHTLKLDAAEAVIYFLRPVESDDPKVVGVQYSRDGTAALFFGVILAP